MSELVIISGMSGAGRTQVSNALEDLGWNAIDNLPPELISQVPGLIKVPEGEIPHVAVALGPGANGAAVRESIEALREQGTRVRVVFLDASTAALVRRYESTKRRHPFDAGTGLAAAIERERSHMWAVRDLADVVVETSELNVHQLKARIVSMFGEEGGDELMQTTVMSFGYKHGLPPDVDLVLDCRFLANPYWVEDLRPLTGRDDAVRDFVWQQPDAAEFLDRLTNLLELVVPRYRAEGKSYLTIALGCTGGHHRSVAIAEALRDRLAAVGVTSRVRHRDIDR